MGFSFINLYQWLLDRGIADREVPVDDFIQKGLNGFNSTVFVSWYDKHRELEAKLAEAETDKVLRIKSELEAYRAMNKNIEKLKVAVEALEYLDENSLQTSNVSIIVNRALRKIKGQGK